MQNQEAKDLRFSRVAPIEELPILGICRCRFSEEGNL